MVSVVITAFKLLCTNRHYNIFIKSVHPAWNCYKARYISACFPFDVFRDHSGGCFHHAGNCEKKITRQKSGGKNCGAAADLLSGIIPAAGVGCPSGFSCVCPRVVASRQKFQALKKAGYFPPEIFYCRLDPPII